MAETAIMGSAVTKMLFNTNLLEFATGTIDGKYNPGADGGQNITLPELFGFTKSGWNISNIGGAYGKTYATSFTNAVADNFGKNAGMSVATLLLTPVAFKFGRKIARKPLREVNKLLKGTGVRV